MTSTVENTNLNVHGVKSSDLLSNMTTVPKSRCILSDGNFRLISAVREITITCRKIIDAKCASFFIVMLLISVTFSLHKSNRNALSFTIAHYLFNSTHGQLIHW